jgi:membrane protein required for colicin V production
MEVYDLIMLVVFVGATLFGYVKGMAWQIASLLSYGASYFVSLKFSDRLAPFFGDQAPLNRFAAMLAIYAGTAFVIWMGFRTIRQTIDRVQLRSFDRQLGALLGAAKGVALCLVVTFFAVGLSQSVRESALRSRSGHYIAEFIRTADPIMPPEIHDVLDPYLEQITNELDPAGPPVHRLGRTISRPPTRQLPLDPPAELNRFIPRLDDEWRR